MQGVVPLSFTTDLSSGLSRDCPRNPACLPLPPISPAPTHFPFVDTYSSNLIPDSASTTTLSPSPLSPARLPSPTTGPVVCPFMPDRLPLVPPLLDVELGIFLSDAFAALKVSLLHEQIDILRASFVAVVELASLSSLARLRWESHRIGASAASILPPGAARPGPSFGFVPTNAAAGGILLVWSPPLAGVVVHVGSIRPLRWDFARPSVGSPTDSSSPITYGSSVSAFHSFVEEFGLFDVPLSNGKFTWSNNRNLPILRRLDRVFLSPELFSAFPSSFFVLGPRHLSDLVPLLLSLLRGRAAACQRSRQTLLQSMVIGSRVFLDDDILPALTAHFRDFYSKPLRFRAPLPDFYFFSLPVSCAISLERPFLHKEIKNTVWALGSADPATVLLAEACFGCKATGLPMDYLGLQISLSPPAPSFWHGVEQKLVYHLQSWQEKLLSLPGRITLAKHCPASVPLHALTVFRPPVAVLKRFDKINRNFIWDSDRPSDRLAHWDVVALLRLLGGAGITNLKRNNRVFTDTFYPSESVARLYRRMFILLCDYNVVLRLCRQDQHENQAAPGRGIVRCSRVNPQLAKNKKKGASKVPRGSVAERRQNSMEKARLAPAVREARAGDATTVAWEAESTGGAITELVPVNTSSISSSGPEEDATGGVSAEWEAEELLDRDLAATPEPAGIANLCGRGHAQPHEDRQGDESHGEAVQRREEGERDEEAERDAQRNMLCSRGSAAHRKILRPSIELKTARTLQSQKIEHKKLKSLLSNNEDSREDLAVGMSGAAILNQHDEPPYIDDELL
ncbi:putative ribonuclease H protein [Nymphaea thermarum]|nr:putative ribonuclease H protein [Nymphaea thermarum]